MKRLTFKILQKIEKTVLDSGLDWEGAAILNGVDHFTFNRWLWLAKEKPDSIHGELLQKLQNADKQNYNMLLNALKKSARNGSKGAGKTLKERGITY